MSKRHTPFWRGVAIGVFILCGGARLVALPEYGADCSSCHRESKTGMTLTNFQGMANLGAGTLKVYQGSPGGILPIQIYVTNTFDSLWGLAVENLGSAGVTNRADQIDFTPDPTWTSQFSGAYFTQGPVNDSPPELWTFNLAIQTNTPIDAYVAQVQMAGVNPRDEHWSQPEAFYIQVVNALPPAPVITSVSRLGNNLTVRAATTIGFNYYLDYRTSLSTGAWLTATQGTGTGNTLPLTDAGATNAQRFYQIRVQ